MVQWLIAIRRTSQRVGSYTKDRVLSNDPGMKIYLPIRISPISGTHITLKSGLGTRFSELVHVIHVADMIMMLKGVLAARRTFCFAAK